MHNVYRKNSTHRGHMTLREYLFFNGLTVKDFAESLDVSRSYISAISFGHKRPGRKLAKAIYLATEGSVNFLKDLIVEKENVS
jgi:transcriptional regulator with XRE-family HTH domain